MRKNIFLLAVVAACASACGGGGGDESPSVDGASVIRARLDEEIARVQLRISDVTSKSWESMGTLVCTQTHIDRAQAGVEIETMTGLDDFTTWALNYEHAKPSIKYEIGRVLNESGFAAKVSSAYEAGVPCPGAALTASSYAISEAAIAELMSVRDALRRADLLAP